MKSAVITQSGGKSVELKEIPGLFTCLLEHKVTETKAEFNYLGPKITQAAWNEMMAYFEWTFKEHSSEAQVRLFVHPTLGWKVWAFPQEGNTGMTTKELGDNPEFIKQRAEQVPEGYVAWGTVHHHCHTRAFQSSVDSEDEKGQDGLHITVGDMEQPKRSLNCRVYIKGNKFEPNMSVFWDIGPEAAAKIEMVKEFGFSVEDLTNKMARMQMGVGAPEGQTFPKIWADNYITKPKVVFDNKYGSDWRNKLWCHWCRGWVEHKPEDCPQKGTTHNGYENHSPQGRSNLTSLKSAREVLADIETRAALLGVSDDDLDTLIATCGDGIYDDLLQTIMDECSENRVTLRELWLAAFSKAARKESGTPEPKKDGNANGGLTPQELAEKEHQEALEEYYGKGYME